MRLSDLTDRELERRLRGAGLLLQSGPFNYRIRSPIESIAQGLRLLYGDYPLGLDADFVDFDVAIERSGGLRRLWGAQANFCFNGGYPFAPLPLAHAFPLLEWSMNWCVSTQVNHLLTLHSAVIERDGHAVIMAAPPGSGKSTLCAGLVNRGWRLLSDELALISLTDLSIAPLGRPISLKNQSIEVMRDFVPDAVFNAVSHETTKGSVTHMKVPAEQVLRMSEPALPRWVVFPKYQANATAQLTPRSKANSMLELARNSFNYMVLGLRGFEVLTDVISASDCYDFSYSRLDDAVRVFDGLARSERS